MPSKKPLPDYYQTLGVAPGATGEQIRRAYRALAKLHHPDVSTKRDAARQFAQIAAAYAVLSDARKRRGYDASRLHTAEAPGPAVKPGQAHYTWSNIAAAGAEEASEANRIAEIDELYDVFFGKRSGDRNGSTPPSQGGGRRKRGGAKS